MPVPITSRPGAPLRAPGPATANVDLPDAEQLAAQHDESYRNREGLQFKGILDDEKVGA